MANGAFLGSFFLVNLLSGIFIYRIVKLFLGYKVTTLLSLAQALNVPVNSLFNGNEQQPIEELPENVQAIVKLIKNQDSHTLRVIQKQIEALLELTKF